MTAASLPPKRTVAVPAELRPIFDRFLDIQARHVADLEKALAAGDIAAITRLAHAIRGSAATYQIPEAADMALALERLTQHGDLAQAGSLIAALAGYFQNLAVEFADAGTGENTAVASARKSP